MLKLLLKKQLTELFRSYFYDAKKNKKRSNVSIVLYFVLFFGTIIGIFGGIFTKLAITICPPLCSAGMDWLYFLIMLSISIALGAFGSIFNTFSSLYLAKDNDTLLSMPIPVKYIIASRLLNVYLLGALYSCLIIIPATAVYWIKSGVKIGVMQIISGIVMVIIVTLIVLVLSCLLGWCVAKISQKLKRKNITTVILSLAFMAAYYFAYYKANEVINNLIQNAAVFGNKIKGSAYGLYIFGNASTGDLKSILIVVGVTAAIILITWLVLRSTFLSIAISTDKTEKVRYVEKSVKSKSIFGALLSKELNKFKSSANYMLNCGLGIIMIPVAGVVMLFKGDMLTKALFSMEGSPEGFLTVLLCGGIIVLSSMNNMAVPSVSLEGKNLWILQSLPVDTKQILKAKTYMQLILSGIPTAFTVICFLFVFKESVAVKLIFVLLEAVSLIFSSFFDSFIGVMKPNLNWTSEIVAVKNSGAVLISVFGEMIAGGAFIFAYAFLGREIGLIPYLLIWTALFTVGAIVFRHLLYTKGANQLEQL
ncbi:MAG: hypothetical protein MJ125_05875 [Clostridia bacterium]|nr:hypothetical protein [Clostridia bacterium]